MQRMIFNVRPAQENDADALVEMVKALMIHLGDGTANFDEARFLGDAFGDDPQFMVQVAAAKDGKLLGYALYHDAYEPAYAARGTYLSDFFVHVSARGGGVGTALMQAVALDTHLRGRSFIWLVAPGEDAKPFYDRKMNERLDVTAYALSEKAFASFVEAAKR